jgi:hypothetical protein
MVASDGLEPKKEERYVSAMALTISNHELKADYVAIIESVVQGQTFIVTKDGVPVAEIAPISPVRSRFVEREALAPWVNSGPTLDASEWQADLDGVVDQSIF